MAGASFSFEFFPPGTPAGREKLLGETAPALNALGPDFVSCTYGAGGSTRSNTFEVVAALHGAQLNVAPHLSLGGGLAATEELLSRYAALGVKRLVALRGDKPSGTGAVEFAHAAELVALTRQRTGDCFRIAVAAYPEVHPEAGDCDRDLNYLKAKLDAGADEAITQYFYNPDAYFHFRERCEAIGIRQPIIAGIMPITHYGNLARFSRNCGAEIPRWMRQRLESFGGDAESTRQFGIEVVSRLCRNLLEQGCPGLHFYTMNRLEPTREICRNLDLGKA